MLKGKLSVFGKYHFIVEGYDFEDNIPLNLTPVDGSSRRFIDEGIVTPDANYPAEWDSYYVSIAFGSVSCLQSSVVEGETKYKNKVNQQFLSNLGSVIRGYKMLCNTNHQKDKSFSYEGTFNPNSILEYLFDEGTIKLKMRTIVYLNINDKETGISILLEEDGDFSLKLFKPKLTYKFKLELSRFQPNRTPDDGWDFDGEDVLYTLAEIIERNPDKNYLWLNERKYHIVTDLKEVEKVCQKIWRHDGIVAFDTETTGLDFNVSLRNGDGDRLVGMVFAINPGEAWYFPVAHKKIDNICDSSNEQFVIEKYFKPILEKKPLVCHNGSFDWKVMYGGYGIFINLVHDTYILFKVTLWNDHRYMELGLKPLTKQFLGRDSFELSDFVNGKFGQNNIKFWDFDYESTKYYACPDTDNDLELLEYAMKADLLGNYGAKKIYEIEVAFSIVIAYQEYYGHCVDMSRVSTLVDEIETTLKTEYAEMVKLVGHDFNPNSSVQLSKILINDMKYPVMETTDTGNPSTGKVSRSKWMSVKNPDGTDKYPMARHLDKYAEDSTLKSNFTSNLPKLATEDGLCFSTVNQFLETGRVSVNNPNYQSYSDTVKKYIIPREGYYMLDADYSSVEARIMVSMAGCKDMVEKLKDPDMDYHTSKASDMFGVPYELVSKKLRKMSKGVNFGILYGLGDWNLGVNLYGTGSRENAIKASKQKELYFNGMEELRSFINVSRNQGLTQHYSTTYFNRRRYFDPRRTRKDTIERQSCNARIQGTAADIYKISMVRLLNQIRKHGWLGKVLISAFVHDECVLEISKSIDPCVMLRVLRECMSLKIKGWCPLFIGCGFGRNWYEAKKTEIPVQVQDKFINTWGETGTDWWDGDTDELYTWEVNEINNYMRDRVINYMNNPDNYGKILHPTENALAHDLLSVISSGESVDGVVDSNVSPKTDMLDNLKEFCKAFDIMDLYEKANIQEPKYEEKSSVEESAIAEADAETEYSKEDIILTRCKTLGLYLYRSGGGKELYMLEVNDPMFMSNCSKLIESQSGSDKLFYVKDGEVYSTNVSIDASRLYPRLLGMYLNRKNLMDIAARNKDRVLSNNA